MRNKNILFLFFARSVFFTQYFLHTISWRSLRRRKKSGHDINYKSDQDKFLSFTTEYRKALSMMTLKACHRKLEAHDIRYV